MDEKNDALLKLQEKYNELIELKTINEAIDSYCEQLKLQMD